MIKTIDPSKLTKGQHCYIIGEPGVYVACFPDPEFCTTAVNIETGHEIFLNSTILTFVIAELINYIANPMAVEENEREKSNEPNRDDNPSGGPAADGVGPDQVLKSFGRITELLKSEISSIGNSPYDQTENP